MSTLLVVEPASSDDLADILNLTFKAPLGDVYICVCIPVMTAAGLSDCLPSSALPTRHVANGSFQLAFISPEDKDVRKGKQLRCYNVQSSGYVIEQKLSKAW